MGKLALQIAALTLNLFLISVFSGLDETLVAWQRHICLFIGGINAAFIVAKILLKWLDRWLPFPEQIFEEWETLPIFLMILNGLALLVFGFFAAGRLFDGPGGDLGLGCYLLAVATSAVSFYYVYNIFYDEEC